MVSPLVVLTTASTAPSCGSHTPFPPAQRLGRDGVSVWWERGGMPGLKWFSTVKSSPTARVGGEPARSATLSPTSGKWRATGCAKAGGNRAMVTQIRPSSSTDSYYLMTACLRGPRFAGGRHAVRQMLASIRFTR
jgi:hypothetical protein